MRLSSIFSINWLATFRLNYNAGGWKFVFRMPIKVYGPLRLSLHGKVILPLESPRNTVIINSEHEDYTAYSRKSQVCVHGTWKIGGFLRLGPDSLISVADGALLETGRDTFLGRDTQIHCYHHTKIGDGVFAGELYVCDSTIHRIFANGNAKPVHGSVIIGDGTYLGFRTVVLKGAVIPPRSVVGSGTVLSSDYSYHGKEKLFLCGDPAIVKRDNVTAEF